MGVPNSDRDQVFATVNVNKACGSDILLVFEVAPNDSADIASNLVHTDSASVSSNVSHCHFNFFLLFIQFFDVSKWFAYININRHV
jgi:hypothetical protein